MMFKTKNGMWCLPTNSDGTLEKKTTDDKTIYCLVQMFPIAPQRVEWVREDNLKEVRYK